MTDGVTMQADALAHLAAVLEQTGDGTGAAAAAGRAAARYAAKGSAVRLEETRRSG
jgi:hypothetical protein